MIFKAFFVFEGSKICSNFAICTNFVQISRLDTIGKYTITHGKNILRILRTSTVCNGFGLEDIKNILRSFGGYARNKCLWAFRRCSKSQSYPEQLVFVSVLAPAPLNHEAISMYWEIGKYVSEKVKTSGWGKSVVADFAAFLQAERPEIRRNGEAVYGGWGAVCGQRMK